MVKIAMIVDNMQINGISTVVMKFCEKINLQKYNIVILAGKEIADNYYEECKKRDIVIIELPTRRKEVLKYYRSLFTEIKKHKFDIIHIHCNSATIVPELLISWLCGVKIRIVHSHNTTCKAMEIHRMMYPLFKLLYTHGFACGVMAGKWLFKNKKFHLIPNGIDIKKFEFSRDARNKVRNQLHIQDKCVIGHIGRFNAQKNQLYLIKVFEEVAKKNLNTFLLLVGAGENFEKIKEIVEKSPYKERILLYGETRDTSEIYSAMDIFVLPSVYEGLPIVLLEAQVSGLKCVVSDKITREIDFGNLEWASIDEEPIAWAEKILKNNMLEERQREDLSSEMVKKISMYDIDNVIIELEKLYSEFYINKENGV